MVSGAVATDDRGFVYEAVRAGLGIRVLPRQGCATHLGLVPVLPDHRLPGFTTHVVYPASRHIPQRVALFRDFLLEQLDPRGDGACGQAAAPTGGILKTALCGPIHGSAVPGERPMRRSLLLSVSALAFVLSVVTIRAGADEKLGAGVTLAEATPIADLYATPEKFIGKTVRIDGVVSAVCTEMGWDGPRSGGQARADGPLQGGPRRGHRLPDRRERQAGLGRGRVPRLPPATRKATKPRASSRRPAQRVHLRGTYQMMAKGQ